MVDVETTLGRPDRSWDVGRGFLDFLSQLCKMLLAATPYSACSVLLLLLLSAAGGCWELLLVTGRVRAALRAAAAAWLSNGSFKGPQFLFTPHLQRGRCAIRPRGMFTHLTHQTTHGSHQSTTTFHIPPPQPPHTAFRSDGRSETPLGREIRAGMIRIL